MSHPHRPLLAFFLFLLGACGADDGDRYQVPDATEAEIVDGRVATASDIHSTVGLVFPEWSCTGTLIEPDVVVTAAHCAIDEWGAAAPGEAFVVAGALDLSLAEQAYRVRRIVPHPDYTVEWHDCPPQDLLDYHDIALVLLADPVHSLKPSWPMSTAEFEARVGPNTWLTISGYGIEHQDEYAGDPNLNITETRYAYRSDFEFFAGGIGQPDTCQGDSGGPAYLPVEGEMILVGVTSRGTAFSHLRCGAGGAYTLVPAYVQWIEDVLDRDAARVPLRPLSSSTEFDKDAVPAIDIAAATVASGCSVGGNPFDEGAPLMLFAALVMLAVRRYA